MLVMINGSFGVGKTTVAEKLVSSIPNSMIYDPEEIGFMLRNIIPENVKKHSEKTNDFQDLELWRILTVDVARSIRETYKKILIVPITIHNKSHFRYIWEGFKKFDEDIYHFCLVAKESTIFDRLRRRGEVEGNWCFQQVVRCVEAFRDELFEEHIHTDFIEIDDIVKHIQEKIHRDKR